jgi:ATP-dependent Clp protease ATP-binding subunit ClpA
MPSRRRWSCRRNTSTTAKLPDKAIDVIDETGASQMLVPERRQAQEEDRRQGGRGDDRHDGAHPAEDRVQGRRGSAVQSSKDLKRVVFGQDKAIDRAVAAIKLARAGLREPEKPIGCYLFSGPTGVGKTEVARSWNLMGVELLRFDMSNTWRSTRSRA